MSTTPNTRIPIEEALDPILLDDPVLQQLEYLDQINVDYLKNLSGFTTNKVNALYKTEFLIHMSISDKQGLSRQEIANRVGIHKDNVNRNFVDYGLPQNLDRQSDIIHVKSLQKELEVTSNRIYGWYKISLLYQIFEALQQGMDLKQAAKLSDMPYDKTRKLYSQYQLKQKLRSQEPEQLTPIHTTMSTIMSMQPAKKTHTIQVHPSTRLFHEDGRIIRAEDLIKTPELLKNNYLMLDHEIRLTYGNILDAKLIKSEAVTINTMSGGFLTIGKDTAVFSDKKDGLLTTKVSNINEKDVILNCRHFKGIKKRIPPIFELLQHPPGRPEVAFVFDKTISDTITTRLSNKFKDLKDAATKLDVRYKHGLTVRQYRYSELKKIVEVLGYPDINHPDFMNGVEKVSYAIQGGRPIDVDRFKVDTDLLYLMGLVASDGYASQERKAVLGFGNKIKPLVMLFRSILLQYFPSITASIRDPTKKHVTYEVAINHYPLRMVMYNLNIKGDELQFDEDTAYFPIFRLPEKYIRAFLRGLFDGDGTVDIKGWRVSIAVFHPQRSKNVQLLLKRLNIDSKVQYTQQIELTPPNNEHPTDSDQWNVIIEGRKDIAKFHGRINPSHPVRGPALKKMVDKLQKKNTLASKYNFAPKKCSALFRAIRMNNGILQKQISTKSTFGTFELGNSRKTISQVRNYLKVLNQLEPDHTTKEYIYLNNLLQPIYNLDRLRELIYHQIDEEKNIDENNRELEKDRENKEDKKEDIPLNIELIQPTNLIELKVSSNLVADTGIVISGLNGNVELGLPAENSK